MSAGSFQIRLCQNPDCGLRYPLIEGQVSGERCPLCLGGTRVVMESALPKEAESQHGVPFPNRHYEVLLDNIRSAWNAGSILRSADGFGFRHAYFCGITPDPDNPGVRKTALGAERSILWSVHRNAVDLVRRLKEEGYYILALETCPGAIPLNQFDPELSAGKPILLIAGGEVCGIDPGLLAMADLIVCLPMRGAKRSLNVAVAFGAAACQISSH